MTFIRILLMLLALYPGCLLAQEVAFTYVAPAADIDAQFGAGGVTGGDIPAGYKGIDLTDGNEATFTSNAPPRILHLYQQLQAGTTLRDRIDEVMQISGGRVDVTYFLVDDRTGLSGDTGAMTPFTHNSQTHVWPAASVSPRGDDSGRYDGKIGMGETAGDVIATNLAGGILAWEGTALHETSHTQFVGPWTKWGAINQRAITYGEDGDHYSEELLGDQAAALDEGHGTFYGNLHNAAERRETIDFFTRDDHRYFVEARSVLAGSEPLYTVEERRSGTVGGTDVWEYKWEDVPGFYLLFSESTATAFYVFFWQHVNGDQGQAFEMITASSRDMWEDRLKRFLTFACNRLALQLEEYAASTEGQAAQAAGTLTSSMFPFALLDILTHFGMSEEEYRADYRRRYPDREPRAFEAYWGHREAVQRLVEEHLSASPIRIEEAVEAAHDYFRSSDRILTAEGGAGGDTTTTAGETTVVQPAPDCAAVPARGGSCWTTEDVLDSPIDHHAQSALLRMFARGDLAAVEASQILCAAKTGAVEGVYLPAQRVPAQRARAVGSNYWEMIPADELSTCYTDSPPGTESAPLIVFRDRIKANRDLVARALSSAWGACGLPATTARCYTETITRPPEPEGECAVDEDCVRAGTGNRCTEQHRCIWEFGPDIGPRPRPACLRCNPVAERIPGLRVCPAGTECDEVTNCCTTIGGREDQCVDRIVRKKFECRRLCDQEGERRFRDCFSLSDLRDAAGNPVGTAAKKTYCAASASEYSKACKLKHARLEDKIIRQCRECADGSCTSLTMNCEL